MKYLFWICSLLILVEGVDCYWEGHVSAELYDAPIGFTPRYESPDSDEGMLRIFAIGDAGTGDWRQRLVASSMENHAENYSDPEAVLILGDIFYPDGIESPSDSRWGSEFRDMYTGPLLDAAFRPVLGNHDFHGRPQAYIEYSQLDARWQMPALYYSFEMEIPSGGTVAFFALDTSQVAVGEVQLEWLSDGLSRTEADWIVVFGHHPIDSGGKHGGEPALVERLLPVLVDGGVDFYLSGHDHHLALMNTTPLHTIVAGAGGKIRSAHWTESTEFAATQLGFCELLFEAERAYVRFVDYSGKLLASHLVPRLPAP